MRKRTIPGVALGVLALAAMGASNAARRTRLLRRRSRRRPRTSPA